MLYNIYIRLSVVVLVASFLACSTNKNDSAKNNIILSKPSIMKVKEWGGNPPLETKAPQKIKYITIHHSGVEFPEDKDPIQSMRNLQRFSQIEKEWLDIPYHYSMDLDGKFYEARPIHISGDTNTEYDPEGHVLIEVMGNYEVQTMKEKQLDSLAYFTAWLAQLYDVPLENIATHKDYSAMTVCPGKDLYKYFENGEFIAKVEAHLTNE